jgi:isopenicillin N synthase-like dioxygenase
MAVPAAAVPAFVERIDVSPCVELGSKHRSSDHQSSVARFGASLDRSGFAVIANHGVSADLVGNLRRCARDFFDRDLDEKLQYSTGPVYGLPGYTQRGIEAVSRTYGAVDGGESLLPDPVESLIMPHGMLRQLIENLDSQGDSDGLWAKTCSDIPGCPPPALAAAAARYFGAVEALVKALNRMAAVALELPSEDFFNAFYTQEEASYTLRLANYPALVGGDDETRQPQGQGQPRYGAHTDYEAWTVLLPDPHDGEDIDAGGLEVQRRSDGTWVPVRVEPGDLIVNIGDLMEVWTAGRWQSTVHRVRSPSPASSAARRTRFSVPFFVGPDPKSLIEPLTGPGTTTPVDSKYRAVRAGEHLAMKLGLSNG